MSELEKLRAEVKILKAEKERAEMEASFKKTRRNREESGLSLVRHEHIYIRQSKKNTKNIIIQSLHFVNLVMFLEQLIINGYTEKFLKVSKRIGLLPTR